MSEDGFPWVEEFEAWDPDETGEYIFANQPLTIGDTFHEMVSKGKVEEMSLILDLYPEVLDAVQQGETALLTAIKRGNLAVVNFLLERGSQAVTIPDRNNSLPIHWACQGGHREIAERLVSSLSEADRIPHLHSVNRQLWTPLWYAFMYAQNELGSWIFRLAPTALLIPDKTGNTLFGQEEFHRSSEILALLRLSSDVLSDQDFRSALFESSEMNRTSFAHQMRQGSPEVIDFLLSHFPEVIPEHPDDLVKMSLDTLPGLVKIWTLGSQSDPEWARKRFRATPFLLTTVLQKVEVTVIAFVVEQFRKMWLTETSPDHRNEWYTRLATVDGNKSLLDHAVRTCSFECASMIADLIREVCGHAAVTAMVTRESEGKNCLYYHLEMMGLDDHDTQEDYLRMKYGNVLKSRTATAELLISLGAEWDINHLKRAADDQSTAHVRLFRTLNPSMSLPLKRYRYNKELLAELARVSPMDESLELRDRIYFRSSLVSQLLLHLD